MQEGRPIAYLSKSFSPKLQSFSIYEKKLLAIITTVSKWRHYLEEGTFITRTDQKSIKHFLEQRLHIIIQVKKIMKLLGLRYNIQYKKGKENWTADNLSLRGAHQGAELSNIMTMVVPI